MPELSPGKHLVKRRRQLRHKRAFDLQPHIAPAVFHTVTLVLRRDVEPADKRNSLVANQQLPVVAYPHPIQSDRIENPYFAARDAQRLPEAVRQMD